MLGNIPATQSSYFHHDHLGSLVAISNEAGVIIERLAYDPWGKRRYPSGTADSADAIVGINADRGYTMHEHLDEIGVIHMNGRIYDPLIGRFMSADPYIQYAGNLQSYNRYSYVLNNPLILTDPSGYLSLGNILKIAVVIAIAVYAPQISAYLRWTGGVVASGAAAGTAMTGGLSAAIGLSGTVASGALAGFIGGVIMTGTLQGGLIGAVTGGAFSAVGSAFPTGVGNVLGHAFVGCASASLQGGDCEKGAIAAAAGSLFTQSGVNFNNVAANTVAHAIVGGVASVLAGGRFESGAWTSAFGYLFNYFAHKWGRPETLEKHFKYHGSDFGAKSASEYAKMADADADWGQRVDSTTKANLTTTTGKALQMVRILGRSLE